ncbi:Uncharacterized membrane protein YhaH, DUF805 family [Bifidobacterium commune]|uniref:Uncharacterized membrane protein YhaH, DUF805 family n=1 Tax=Bifidobacterium commune TaxID=1505727 RepID=A0A1C4H6K3_9BIFI|nr:DUF805 domain-containing protein [Bifidobacterium commune]SCC80589.1 Uncharacterized membrane protein YhaH, DUF805 family [Bifidobacterium commune]
MNDMNAMNGANDPNIDPANPNQNPYGATQQTQQNNAAPQQLGTDIPPYQPTAEAPAQPINPNPQYNQGGNYGAPAAVEVPLNKPFYGCPPPEAIKRFFVKYANFKGRASRSEFWWIILFIFVVKIIISLINSIILDTDESFIDTIWSIAIFIPFLSLNVRRLHDTNKSGWWLLLPAAITFVCTVTMVVLLLFAGYHVSSLSDTDIAQDIANSAAIGLIIGAFILLICYLASFVIYIVFMSIAQKPEGVRYDEITPAQPVMQSMMQGEQRPPMNQQSFRSTNETMPQSGQETPAASYNQQPGMPTEMSAQPDMPSASGEQPYVPAQPASMPIQQPNVAPSNGNNTSDFQPPFMNGNGSNQQ